MRRLPRPFFLVALVALGALGQACSQSTTPGNSNADSGTDAYVDPDSGSSTDAGTDSGTDAGAPYCGNRIVEGTEECDDMNLVDTDACKNDCTFPPVCGDGNMDVGEQCDDGDNHSGDGCSGTCKNEVCNNMILDPGEVCDSTPNCSATCDAVTGCGDGTKSATEQCDDGNTTSWDGCSNSCLVEQATVLSDIAILTNGGCDLTGDGLPDALFGSNLETVIPTLAPLVNNAIRQSPFNTLVAMGLEDPTLATDDPSVRLGWVTAADANGSGMDFDGTGQVRVQPASLLNGDSRLAFPSSVTSMRLNGGPEDITIPFFMGYNLGVRRARVVDTPVTVTGTAPPRVSVASMQGLLCGVAEVAPFAGLPNVFASLAGGILPTTSCDTTAVPTNQVRLSDLLVGGAFAAGGFVTLVAGVDPDVDLDGDGLEHYVVVGDGVNCQRVVVSCVDGDGTMIGGHACVTDPRMADGWSAAFRFTAPVTTLVP